MSDKLKEGHPMTTFRVELPVKPTGVKVTIKLTKTQLGQLEPLFQMVNLLDHPIGELPAILGQAWADGKAQFVFLTPAQANRVNAIYAAGREDPPERFRVELD